MLAAQRSSRQRPCTCSITGTPSRLHFHLTQWIWPCLRFWVSKVLHAVLSSSGARISCWKRRKTKAAPTAHVIARWATTTFSKRTSCRPDIDLFSKHASPALRGIVGKGSIRRRRLGKASGRGHSSGFAWLASLMGSHLMNCINRILHLQQARPAHCENKHTCKVRLWDGTDNADH